MHEGVAKEENNGRIDRWQSYESGVKGCGNSVTGDSVQRIYQGAESNWGQIAMEV